MTLGAMWACRLIFYTLHMISRGGSKVFSLRRRGHGLGERKKVGYGASAGTLSFSMGVSREWSAGVMLVPLSAIVFSLPGARG